MRDRLEHGATAEQQGAIAVLAAMPGDAARGELSHWLDRLIAGRVPPEIQLDLIEAARGRSETDFHRKLEQYQSSKPKNDPMAPYREVLAGGDAQRGMTIFKTKAALECVRCHKVKETAGDQPVGGEVGPELSAIGARQTRAYLLESIVDPNKQIAQGFESVVLATSDGKVHTGVLRGEDDKEVRLITAEGKPLAVPKDTIEDRKRGPSAMPADLVREDIQARAARPDRIPGEPEGRAENAVTGAGSGAAPPVSPSSSRVLGVRRRLDVGRLGFRRGLAGASDFLALLPPATFLDMFSLKASIAGFWVPLNGTVPVSGGVSLQPASVKAITTPAIKLHTRRIDVFSHNEFKTCL